MAGVFVGQPAEKVAETRRCALYRERLTDGDQPVLVKRFKSARPEEADLADLRAEFDIMTGLIDSGWTLQPVRLLHQPSQCALVFRDFDGRAPDPATFFEEHGLPGFLELAVNLVRAIDASHRRHVIHRNLKPGGVLYRSDDWAVRLHGFRALSFGEARRAPEDPDSLLESLRSLAPEQTGRVNWPVSRQSDFYALGLIFHELLTGRPPFNAKDPVEMTHAHVAKTPPSTSELRTETPEALAAIVLKLLSKTPEDRYQSGVGLIADLERCARQFAARGRVALFALGERDISREFQFPRKIYGRERELERVMAEFELARQGQARFLTLTGPSGMGKSEFAGAIQKAVVARRGCFISGKADATQRGLPYSGFIDAFRDLIRQRLTDPPEQAEAWRSKLRHALGVNAGVLNEVLPDLELLVGETAPAPQRGVAEAHNRFRLTLLNFIRVFAVKELPLVVCIDDLHHAGAASCELLLDLFSLDGSLPLLVIGIARNEALADNPAVRGLIGKLRQQGAAAEALELQPLDRVHIQAVLRDAFSCEPHHTKALAATLLKKCRGVPFYLSVYLKSLVDRDLFRFNEDKSRWEWDLERIRADRTESEGMIDWVMQRVAKLPEDTQDALRLASCIGVRFGLQMLATALKKDLVDTAALLQPAIKDGVIVPVGDAFKIFQIERAGDAEHERGQRLGVFCQFTHSRVREAVYASMDHGQSQAKHLQVGQQMLKRIRAHNLQGDIFKVVSQLNFGREFIDSESERLQLARLNLTAGLRSRNANAFTPACRFLETGLALLPADAPSCQRELWFDLSLALAETESLNGSLEEGAARFANLRKAAEGLNETSRVYSAEMQMLNNSSRFDACLEAGLAGLAEIDMKMPVDADALVRATAADRDAVMDWVREHGVEGLRDLPEAKRPETQAQAQLLLDMTPSAYNANRELFELVVLRQVRLALDDGRTPFSPNSFALLGILTGIAGDYRTGSELGQLAVELGARLPDPLGLLRIKTVCCNFLNHWRRHFRENLPILEDLKQEIVAHGDLVYANYNHLVALQHYWMLNEPLLTVLDEGLRCIEFADQSKNIAVREALRCFTQAALNLRGLTLAPDTLSSADFDEEAARRVLADSAYFTGLTVSRLVKAEVLTLRGFHERALAETDLALETERFNENTVMIVNCVFFRALALASLATDMAPDERAGAVEEIAGLRDRFAIWVENCADNYLCRYALIQAELARLAGRSMEAARRYREAGREAERQGFIQVAAMAYERAARFFRDEGFPEFAGWCLRQAWTFYRRWGAIALAADLRRELADLWDAGESPETASAVAATQAFDMTTMFKAAQAISGEIQVARLIEKMMGFLIENAGAQRGLLLLYRDGALAVEAEYETDAGKTVLTGGAPLEWREDLAKSAVHFVSRAKSDLLIDDAAEDQRFLGDGYLRQAGVKSLLCMPILRGAELVGVLYLENHLTKGAFAGNRLELLRMLSPQIAISLENARYVEEMTQLNEVLRGEVQVRKQAEAALQKAQKIAVENARKAGKAEFATSVLHNIKNVLNSLWLARSEISQLLEDSKLPQLGRCVDMIAANRENIGAFMEQNAKGRLLPAYLEKLYAVLSEDHRCLLGEMKSIVRHLSLMKDIIETQQAHAKGALLNQTVALEAVIEDALRVQAEALTRHGIEVCKSFDADQLVRAEKTRLTHVLINLVKNAIEAMGLEEGPRRLTLESGVDQNGCVVLRIRDTGMGIGPKDLENLFSHGFTTKEDGHGFGLHYCANVMKEMGGHLRAESGGLHQGATFILTFAPNEDEPAGDPLAG